MAAAEAPAQAGGTKDIMTRLMDVLSSEPEGLLESQVETLVGPKAAVVAELNRLVSENRVAVDSDTGELRFKLVEEHVAEKLRGLEAQVMMVYAVIERAGNFGIWNRDIKNSTGMQQNVLGKALKELEKRSLIKSVKSIHQKTKKIWMVYELTPSPELTGGPWYTDNEFDHEFVNEIAKLVEGQIHDNWSRDASLTTLRQVDERVKSSGISNEQLTTEHIKQVLNRLSFDLKIEQLDFTPAMRPIPDDPGPYYRSQTQSMLDYDAFTTMPCGVCPVLQQCTPGGLISPETCKYFSEWFEGYPAGDEDGGADPSREEQQIAAASAAMMETS